MKNDNEKEILEKKIEIEKVTGKESKKDYIRYTLYMIIFLLVLFVSTFGITVSFYKGTSKPTDNTIVTDTIVFTYSDVDRGGNGIYLKDAIPTSDNKGKAMIGRSQYFDFSITATSKNTDILYKILVNKDRVSTLANKDVRIYLASLTGEYEQELVLKTFSNLRTERINGTDYYVLYQKTLNKGIEDYSDNYRLKMWVKEDATDYYDKTFKLKVDVIAEQVGD